MTRIIAFANQKGGVGKTTTAINIGASLAAVKQRVLLIDMDPQGNAGTGMGFDRSAHNQSVYDVIMGMSPAADNILSTAVQGMHIMPASDNLTRVDLEFPDIENSEYRLRDALAPIMEHYDYILLDCPPSFGALTLNAMTTADSVIIPMQCEFFALDGITKLINNIKLVRQNLNPELEVLGIVLTMYDKRAGLTRAVEDDLRRTFGDKVFKTVVPRNVRVSEAPSHGKPALFYDFNSTGAQAYLRVATEVVQKIKGELDV